MFTWKLAIIFLSPLFVAFTCGKSATEVVHYKLSPCPASLPTFREDETSYISIDTTYKQCADLTTYDSRSKDIDYSGKRKSDVDTNFHFGTRYEPTKECVLTIVLRAQFCQLQDKECLNNPSPAPNSAKLKQRILDLWFSGTEIKATEVSQKIYTADEYSNICHIN